MRHIRVFVSSPGDALHERRRVERVVERLNAVFSKSVRLATGFYAAHDTFQAQIPETAKESTVMPAMIARMAATGVNVIPRATDRFSGSPCAAAPGRSAR